jgi:aspartyl-tRNA(Asn)/glutamyl-tRNA(Gln) amidotransferase subunit B
VKKKGEGLFEGATGLWELVVGLEIHAQIIAKTKLFSDAPIGFGKPPNSYVSVVDAAFPGTLPVLNDYCVDQTIKTGLALNGRINRRSVFERKHYFYADLPAGYQITQQLAPLVVGGEVELTLPDRITTKKVRINRIQLETDSGKSLHDQHPLFTFVDLNRAGVPLMEIVSEPDMNSSLEAAIYLKKLHRLLKHIGTCEGNLEMGSLRCDTNVSVRKRDKTVASSRCEIKNLNSVKALIQAIDYEAMRQITTLESGGAVHKETRFFDASKKITISGRSKEEERDYRYFPEPDLPPLIVSESRIEAIRRQLPELPDAIKKRLCAEYKLNPYDAEVITDEDATVFFENLVKGSEGTPMRDPITCSHWLTNILFGLLNSKNLTINESPVSPERLGALIDLVKNGTVTSRNAKDVLTLMFEGDSRHPNEIITEKGWTQLPNTIDLESLCKRIIEQNPKEVRDYEKRPDRMMRFFVGQVMKETQGRADATRVTEIFKRLLDK